MEGFRKKIRLLFPLSWKGWLVFALAMAAGSAVCTLLQTVSTSDVHVPMIFVLMVLIVSMLTDGYFYGSLAAVASVCAVNWAFTYPYMKLDFSAYGYPLTFITMLAVGIASSALATRLKEQQKLRLEAEREKTRANLLRSVSHDLRTPLTSISGSVSAVLEDNGSMTEAEKRELLSNARDDAQQRKQARNPANIKRMLAVVAGWRIERTTEPSRIGTHILAGLPSQRQCHGTARVAMYARDKEFKRVLRRHGPVGREYPPRLSVIRLAASAQHSILRFIDLLIAPRKRIGESIHETWRTYGEETDSRQQYSLPRRNLAFADTAPYKIDCSKKSKKKPQIHLPKTSPCQDCPQHDPMPPASFANGPVAQAKRKHAVGHPYKPAAVPRREERKPVSRKGEQQTRAIAGN